MKLFISKFFVVAVVLIGFISCEPEVSFSESQPSGIDAAAKFKRKFKGKYLSVSDSSILVVTKTNVTQNWHFIVELDSNRSVKDLVRNISIDVNESDLKITAINDSTSYVVDYRKVIFEISNQNQLKYVNGVCFLNSKENATSWEVKTMQFDENGFLIIHDLEMNANDLDELKQLTEVSEETDEEGEVTEYSVHPTVKEFDEIIKSGIFEDGEKFVRIK